MCRASGGMASVPTRFTRATATERAAEPGAMMRASVMPRLPSVGVMSQALVLAQRRGVAEVEVRRRRTRRAGGNSSSWCVDRRARATQRRAAERIGDHRKLRRRLRQRRRQRVDGIERGELVGGAPGGIAEVAVELADLEAQRAARGGRMALQALRLAREFPGLPGDLHGLAADHARGVGAARVPLVGVARPVAVVVAHEEARLHQRGAEAEVLHQHAAVREIEIVVARRW